MTRARTLPGTAVRKEALRMQPPARARGRGRRARRRVRRPAAAQAAEDPARPSPPPPSPPGPPALAVLARGPAARRRALRAPDVGLPPRQGPARTTTRWSCGGGCGSTTRSRSTSRSAAASCRTSRLQQALGGARPGTTRSTARSSWVHWLWFFEPHGSLALDPRQAPRALPAVGPADVGRLRHRLRVYCGGADRAALVGLGERLPDDRGAADHAGGRRGAVGPRLGPRCTPSSAATRGRRCPRFTSPPR